MLLLNPQKYEFTCSPPAAHVFSIYNAGETLSLKEEFYFHRVAGFGERVHILSLVHLYQGHQVALGTKMHCWMVRRDGLPFTDDDFAEILTEIILLLRSETIRQLEKENIEFTFPEIKSQNTEQYVSLLRKNELDSFHRP